MMRSTCCLLIGLFTLTPAVTPAAGAAPKADAKKYTLRYRFHPGETLRWEVEHRSKVDTTVSDTTKTAETLSKSVKVWRVQDAQPDGTATFEHLVESVDMRQKMNGAAEVRYNSRTDKKAPLGFEHVARSVGVALSIVTMDTRGNVLKRVRKQAKAGTKSDGQMTIPLPEEAVPVGHTWSRPHEIHVKLPTGGIKRVEARQTFTLQGVKTGVATIEVATQILTPIHDPKVESQLIQRESTGTVRFDVDAGRILTQQMELDKRVVGFHTDASTVHYLTRFTERLLPSATKTAGRTMGPRR